MIHGVWQQLASRCSVKPCTTYALHVWGPKSRVCPSIRVLVGLYERNRVLITLAIV